jgi:hypothetical protein
MDTERKTKEHAVEGQEQEQAERVIEWPGTKKYQAALINMDRQEMDSANSEAKELSKYLSGDFPDGSLHGVAFHLHKLVYGVSRALKVYGDRLVDVVRRHDVEKSQLIFCMEVLKLVRDYSFAIACEPPYCVNTDIRQSPSIKNLYHGLSNPNVPSCCSGGMIEYSNNVVDVTRCEFQYFLENFTILMKFFAAGRIEPRYLKKIIRRICENVNHCLDLLGTLDHCLLRYEYKFANARDIDDESWDREIKEHESVVDIGYES